MVKNRIDIDFSNSGEEISYSIGTIEDKTSLIELTFITNLERIYRTSDYKRVLHPPRNIILHLAMDEIVELSTSLVNAISVYFQNNEIIENKREFISKNNYKVVLQKPLNVNNRSKIIINIYDNSNSEQIISFGLNKTKAIILLMLIKDTYEKLQDKNTAIKTNSGKFVFTIYRDEDFIGINNIWLRNTEIEIIKHLINSIIYDFRFEKKFNDYKKIYRQLLIFMNPSTNKIVLSIKKMNDNEKVIHFSLNPNIVASMLLSLSVNRSFKGDAIDEY